jgi:hypothetical protein
MLSTSFIAAPAGFAGLGVEVRPSADCAAVRRYLGGAAVPVQGSGVPTVGGNLGRRRGTGLRTTGVPIALLAQQKFDQIPQHDGTTLGYHSSGRPLS